MPAPPRFPLFPPDVTLAFSRASLRALRALARGALDDVDPDDRLAFAAALFTRRFEASFADLLDEVARLSDEAGREALVEAALDRGLDPSRWLDVSPADLALRVTRKAAHAPVVARAHVRLGRRFARRAWYEAVTTEAGPDAGAIVAASRAVHGERVLTTFSADTEDGAVHVAAIHEGPAVRGVARSGGALRARRERPLACDVVRSNRTRGRVSFQLARPALLTRWTGALAACLERDRVPFTLKLLHERGAAALAKAKLPAPVLSAEIVACELDDGTRFGVRGDGALDAMHARLGHGGYVYRVTIRFRIAGAPRPIDATIELPDKLLVAEARWLPAVCAAIDALGLTAPGALADDLASLAPFVHPEWRWVKVLGADGFRAALAERTLVRTASRRAGEARHRVWGAMYTVHAIDGEDARYAVADDPAAPAHTVKAEALTSYRLDDAALASKLRERLVLEPCAGVERPAGLIPIGLLPLKTSRLVFFLLAAIVPEGESGALREAVRKACPKGATPVVLVGRGRSLHGGIAEVAIGPDEQLGAPSVARVVAEAARATGLEEEIEAWRFGTPSAPVVLVREAREVWLGRVRLALTAAQVDAVEILARERSGEWMAPLKLGKALSPNATWHEQIARKTLGDLEARVERSFEEAGVEMPEEWRGRVVEMKKGKGYRVGLGVVVR